MKKVRVTRLMLASYVRKLVLESASAPGRQATEFIARAELTGDVVASVLAGGTDFGQAFEGICLEMLRKNGYAAFDLNPVTDGGYSVEDSEQEKKASENAELADTIIYEDGASTQAAGESTVEDLDNIVLLSAKANKGPKAFIGPVTKFRSKLKKLLKKRVLNTDQLQRSVSEIRARVGTLNIALNPQESLAQESIIYDVLLSMPMKPNVGIVNISPQVQQELTNAKISVNTPNFSNDILPTWIEGSAKPLKLGNLGRLINFNATANISSPHAFSVKSSSTNNYSFTNVLSISDNKNGFINSLKQLNDGALSTSISETITSLDDAQDIADTLRENGIDALLNSVAERISNDAVNVLVEYFDAQSEALQNFITEKAAREQKSDAFWSRFPEEITDKNALKRQATKNTKMRQDLSSLKDTLKRKQKNLNNTKARKNSTQSDIEADKKARDEARQAFNIAVKEKFPEELLNILDSADVSKNEYDSEIADPGYVASSNFDSTTDAFANSIISAINDAFGLDVATQTSLIELQEVPESPSKPKHHGITNASKDKIKQQVRQNILARYSDLGDPVYENFFVNLTTYLELFQKKSPIGKESGMTPFANPKRFIAMGPPGVRQTDLPYVDAFVPNNSVDNLLDESNVDNVYLLDGNGNPLYNPKDSTSTYYTFHQDYVSLVPHQQLYFRVKLLLGETVPVSDEVKTTLLAKYNELFSDPNVKVTSYENLGRDTQDRNRFAALTFIYSLIDQELSTASYRAPTSTNKPASRKVPRFEPGTDSNVSSTYEYPKPFGIQTLKTMQEQLSQKIVVLEDRLGLMVGTDLTAALKDSVEAAATRYKSTGGVVGPSLEEQMRMVAILMASIEEGIKNRKNENVEISHKEIEIYEKLNSFLDGMLALVNQNDTEAIMRVFTKLSEDIPSIRVAMEKRKKEEPGFFSRLGTRFMQGVEDISSRVGQAVDDLGQALTPQQLAALEEQKLYEAILLDLMEASAKKQRAANRPKKIKITKRQLQELMRRQLK